MGKILAYFRVSLADALVYRVTGFIWMINDVAPALVALVFWLAAFQNKTTIAGYTFASMSLYYLGVMLVTTLVTPFPEYVLSEEIRSGAFSNYLVKPINLALSKIVIAVSWRVIRLAYFIPLVIILWQLGAKNAVSFFNPLNFGLFIFSLFLSFLIIFFIKMILALTTIWFTEAGWLFYTYEIFAGLFSGELIPLDLLPQGLVAVNNWLPFKYMLYFPISLVLNKITSPEELYFSLALDLFWTLFFFWLYRRVLRSGIKNYCAYGG